MEGSLQVWSALTKAGTCTSFVASHPNKAPILHAAAGCLQGHRRGHLCSCVMYARTHAACGAPALQLLWTAALSPMDKTARRPLVHLHDVSIGKEEAAVRLGDGHDGLDCR